MTQQEMWKWQTAIKKKYLEDVATGKRQADERIVDTTIVTDEIAVGLHCSYTIVISGGICDGVMWTCSGETKEAALKEYQEVVEKIKRGERLNSPGKLQEEE